MGDGYFGAVGFDDYSSNKQSSRNTATTVDAILGRRPSAVPAHLTKVLYFPRHDDGTPHLPVYDVSDTYKEAVGDTSIGSTMYTVKISGMKKPQGDGTDGNVSYLLDFERKEGGVVANAEKRATATVSGGVSAFIPTSKDLESTVTLCITGAENIDIAVTTSYPIEPTTTTRGVTQHPFFQFSSVALSSRLQFEWQVHPAIDGPLRYTLVAIPLAGHDDSDEPDIRAIYHHIGLSFTQGYTEGVFLVPQDTAEEWEAVILGTLLVALWRLRSTLPEKAKGKKEKEKEKTPLKKHDSGSGSALKKQDSPDTTKKKDRTSFFGKFGRK